MWEKHCHALLFIYIRKLWGLKIIKMKAEGLFKASVGEYLFSPWNNNVNIYMYVMDNVV